VTLGVVVGTLSEFGSDCKEKPGEFNPAILDEEETKRTNARVVANLLLSRQWRATQKRLAVVLSRLESAIEEKVLRVRRSGTVQDLLGLYRRSERCVSVSASSRVAGCPGGATAEHPLFPTQPSSLVLPLIRCDEEYGRWLFALCPSSAIRQSSTSPLPLAMPCRNILLFLFSPPVLEKRNETYSTLALRLVRRDLGRTGVHLLLDRFERLDLFSRLGLIVSERGRGERESWGEEGEAHGRSCAEGKKQWRRRGRGQP
jgi:hypothetical protein